MSATINVNLAKCTCPTGWPSGGSHFPRLGETMGCDAEPITIPLRLPPSFSCTVVLGECRGFRSDGSGCSGEWSSPSPSGTVHHDHVDNCPARPVRVSCSMSGKTWGESEVIDVDNAERHDGLFADVDPERVLAVCRDLWTLVKALVTGQVAVTDSERIASRLVALTHQRNAVYAALVRMERGNAETQAGIDDFDKAMGRMQSSDNARPVSERMLEYYVERLIEQVGILGVAP